MIRSHEKSTVTRGEILLDRLEEEITLLKKRHTDLEKLSHTDDHIHFLQVSDLYWGSSEKSSIIKWLFARYASSLISISHFLIFYHQSWQSLSGPSGYEDLNSISVAPYYSFDATKRAIAALKLQVEEVSKTEMSKISGAGGQILLSSPKVVLMSLCRGVSLRSGCFFRLLLLSWSLCCHVFFFNLSLHSEGSLHHARRGDKDKERIDFERGAEDKRGTEDKRRFPEMWVIRLLLAACL